MQNISGYADSEGVHLNWTKYNGEGFRYYKVVRSATNSNPVYPKDGYISAISNVNTVSYKDAKTDGNIYYYRICAVDIQGTVYSSPVLRVQTVKVVASPPTTEDYTINLSAPMTQSVSAKVTQTTSGYNVKLMWSENGTRPSGMSGFKVVGKIGGTPSYPSPYDVASFVGLDKTSHVFSGLSSGNWKFRVGIYNGSVVKYSNEVYINLP